MTGGESQRRPKLDALPGFRLGRLSFRCAVHDLKVLGFLCFVAVMWSGPGALVRSLIRRARRSGRPLAIDFLGGPSRSGQ